MSCDIEKWPESPYKCLKIKGFTLDKKRRRILGDTKFSLRQAF